MAHATQTVQVSGGDVSTKNTPKNTLDDRDAFLERYRGVRAETEARAAPLCPEDQTVQSMPEASPTKWHRAHTNWFFETFLLKPFSAYTTPMSHLFNSYYEQIARPFPRHQRGLLSRPTCADVAAERSRVDDAMTCFIQKSSQKIWDAAVSRVLLGLHHEQQHQELILTDIKHALSYNPLKPKIFPQKKPKVQPPKPLLWHDVQEGFYEIGARGEEFAFDNEKPFHNVYLTPFRFASRLVTNREFLGFMEDGGYERSEFWLTDGLAYGWKAPLYWRRTQDTDRWDTFTLHGEHPLDLDAPVCHVSYYEASAYAAWAGARLLREAEWEVAARQQRMDFGHLWEWTLSPYTPYPGFTPWESPLGEYNGKFMCNQYVLRGGAHTTPAGHCRPTYRNFFYPQARWQFSGIRLGSDF